MVHLSLDSDFPTIKAEVDLGSIPMPDQKGYEVIVRFDVDNFDND